DMARGVGGERADLGAALATVLRGTHQHHHRVRGAHRLGRPAVRPALGPALLLPARGVLPVAARRRRDERLLRPGAGQPDQPLPGAAPPPPHRRRPRPAYPRPGWPARGPPRPAGSSPRPAPPAAP